MHSLAIVIYGPPGSGKSTQAKLLAENLGFIHYDIGARIESVVHDPKNRSKKIIERQRKLFDAGDLCEPAWVMKLVAGDFKRIAQAGFGIVLSGSLRTLPETFGEGRGDSGLLSVLEKAYGRKNIAFFLLQIPPSASMRRNHMRLVCSICSRPLLTQYFRVLPSVCPVCGGALRKRPLDVPNVIRERLLEYSRETKPVYRELRRRGYRIYFVNGELAPYKVEAKILTILKNR
jgi:adenylate kinase